ncbi:MAG: hypothetical protein ACLFPM_01900 [Candidatus Izemoplasmatales bacterium]
MKKVFLMMFLLMVTLVGCTGESTEQQTTETPFNNYVSIVIGEESHLIGYDDTEVSLFELIQSSDIHMQYVDTDYGPMVLEIGDYKQDDFHWIGFTKNSETASEGLDTIDYEDGDVFEFSENLSTWDQTFTVELESMNDISLVYEIGDYELLIDKESIDTDKLIVGGEYTITGQPSSITGNVVEFEVSEFMANFEYISVVLGDETYDLIYRSETKPSAFDLIDESDIELEYFSTEYGPMITRIGDLQQDDFHWISFTVNDEFASAGLDTIEYQDGDVFSFTEEIATWEVSLKAEIIEIGTEEIIFQNDNQSFVVEIANLPDTLVFVDLVVGFIYDLTGMVDLEASNDSIVFNPSTLELDVLTDFTELYDLEIGDVFILQFTVTNVEDSSEFGFEIFAEDINGLSSTDISVNMAYPSTSDYIFYTIPDDYNLVENETYIGRFIYQINEPSEVPQITLYEESINGETLDNVIVE